MAEIISFGDAAIALAAARAREAAMLARCDTLPCLYCDGPVVPSAFMPDNTAVYRCTCRKIFRVVEDGTVCRGLRGRPF